MSAPPEPINVAGLIISLIEAPGMSSILPMDELIANPLKDDVSAKNIRIELITKTGSEYFGIVDDGAGMDKARLEKSQVIHDRKSASAGGQGFAGIGVAMSLAKITNAKFPATIVSKQQTNEPMEVTRNFPSIMSTNKIPDINVGDITVKSMGLWTIKAINPSQGTLIYCKPSEEYSNQFVESIRTTDVTKNMLIQLGMSWHIPLSNGINIEFVVDGEVHKLKPIDPLAWTKLDKKEKRKTEIEVYTNATNEIRLWFKDTHDKYQEFRNNKAVKDSEYPPDKVVWKRVDKITIRSAYSNKWEEIQKTSISSQKGHELDHFGGYYWTRNPENNTSAKILTHHPNVSKTTETGGMQGIRRACRHDIRFPSALDKLFDVTYNKSHIDKRNINLLINEVIEYIVNLFLKQVYKIVKKRDEASESDASVPKPVPKPKDVKLATALKPTAVPATVPAPAAVPAPVSARALAPAPAAVPAPAPVSARALAPAPPAPAPPAPAAAPINLITMKETKEGTKQDNILKSFGIEINLLTNNDLQILFDGKLSETHPNCNATDRDFMKQHVAMKKTKEEARLKAREIVMIMSN